MDWLRRIAGSGSPAAPAPGETPSEPTFTEAAAPGISALLEGVGEDRSHAVLDFGRASDASLQVYRRFARWVRFADLLGEGAVVEGGAGAMAAVPAHPERPYDLVFGWDVLDRTFPEERPQLVERLARIAAPRARLHVIVRSTTEAPPHPLRFTLVDVGRMRHELVGPARPARPGPLPAEVESLLQPFRVVRAFTLKGGLREYVAIRQDSPS